jgi:transposase, IS5 family
MRTAQAGTRAPAVVRRVTGDLAGLAERAARDAERLLANTRQALRRAQARTADLAAAGIHDAAAGRRRGRLRRVASREVVAKFRLVGVAS